MDVVVVGAGQAGLAVGHHLQRQGLSFVILESGDCVGGSWLRRWDSLTLFTPTRFSSLPGRPFPGDPDGYPRSAEVAAYLQDYASANALPVRLSTSVEKVEKRGRFVLHTNHGVVDAAVVVVTTGAFQLPRVPAFSAGLAPSVRQLHTSDYRNTQQLPSGRVLVVGTGNSGLQVAAELAATHEVHLSAGSKQMALPRRVLGKDIFWWLDRLGFTRASLEKMPKWLAGDGDVLVGQTVKGTARRAGLTLHPRTTGAAADRVAFEDGTDLQVDAVVWATGYRSDYSWLPVAATDDEGRPEHRRGVTPVEGLFFVGLENQYSSASSLLGWVQHDAGFIADQARTVVDGGVSAPGQPSAPSAD
ncbi:flavin-containing monooxygenase [Goekera deserti]|uniref:flavin-containing monooxygenase n=1 Tax=Goekera deserti TaxID=2497753 RepID=UPI001390EE86|nr:NAD(P)/FAD-dependent oxidoreductase [Goekera deserti]